MYRALYISRAEAVLADARASIGPARKALAELVKVIRAAREDMSLVYEAGRALETIRRRKSYRLRKHRTLAEFLAEVGISRMTAYKWRRIATTFDAETVAELGIERAYQRARREPDRPHRGAEDAEDLAARLSAEGLDAKVVPVVRAGRVCLRVELPVEEWSRVGVRRRGKRR